MEIIRDGEQLNTFVLRKLVKFESCVGKCVLQIINKLFKKMPAENHIPDSFLSQPILNSFRVFKLLLSQGEVQETSRKLLRAETE